MIATIRYLTAIKADLESGKLKLAEHELIDIVSLIRCPSAPVF